MQRISINSRILVMVGVGMTIASALIVHHGVSDNEGELQAAQARIAEIQYLIDTQWQDANRLESNANAALTLLLDTDVLTSPKAVYARKLMQTRGNMALEGNAALTPDTLLAHVAAHRTDTVDRINVLYGEQVVLKQRVSVLEEDNRFYMNLALVLQMLGLILVLSRDMARG